MQQLCHAGKSKGSTSVCSVHAGTCIVSTAIEQELQQQLLSEARQAAETAQQQRKAASESASISQPSAGQQPKPSSAKLGEDHSAIAIVPHALIVDSWHPCTFRGSENACGRSDQHRLR